jgi:hypothetical protein
MSGGEGTGLVQIDAVATLKLVFTVPEMAVPAVRPDMQLVVSVAPFPGETFPGQVYFIAPSLDPQNRRLGPQGPRAEPGPPAHARALRQHPRRGDTARERARGP